MQGLIPQPFIDELIHRIDIVELIDSYVPLKHRGNSHIACCPFHHEKTPSFNVVAKKQFYHCFGCSASGNVINFTMNYLHLNFPDAIETLAARAGMQVPKEGKTDHSKESANLYQLLSRVNQHYQQLLKTSEHAIHYLKQRGVNGEVARLYQLGYAPAGWHTLELQFKPFKSELITTGMLIAKEDGKTYDRYRERVTFPIHDRNGRIIGFGARALTPDQKPKYLNSPETIIFQKNRELYGLHQLLSRQKNITQIIIVEGYMDVIALAQHGIYNVVAALGTATSSYHVQLLSKHTQQLIFCFDGDEAGRNAAWRALVNTLPHTNGGLDANFIFLPEGEDPDSLVRKEGPAAFLARLQQALPLHRFFLDKLTQDLDTRSLASKSQMINQAKPYLEKMADGPYKQLLMDELSRITRIEGHRLQQLLLQQTPEIKVEKEKNISRTPLRVATSIMLQHPDLLALCATQIAPSMLKEKKHHVLKTLMEQILKNPAITTARLVELWRETPFFESLNKLAAWEHQVSEEALLHEFTDIIFFLAAQNKEDKIKHLLEKARHPGLTEIERHELQDLLKQRHKNNTE